MYFKDYNTTLISLSCLNESGFDEMILIRKLPSKIILIWT